MSSPTPLDLSSLERAVALLADSLDICASAEAAAHPRFTQQLRAGAIQAFAFTYELCLKMLRRHLEDNELSSRDLADFNTVIRRAYDRGLVSADLSTWRTFRKDRGTTSHTYSDDKAQEVFAGIPAFLAEARHVLAAMKDDQQARP